MLFRSSVGVLDSGFRGEVEFRYKLTGNGVLPEGEVDIYNVGDRVGQIMILPYPDIEFIESETLSSTERGEGGFGSSGN